MPVARSRTEMRSAARAAKESARELASNGEVQNATMQSLVLAWAEDLPGRAEIAIVKT